MPVVPIHYHDSQHPERLHQELLASLRSGQLNQKFLYDSPGQAAKWVALHQACSPSRSDPNCEQTYRTALRSVATTLTSPACHVIGLGCGGGQKDTLLLSTLSAPGRKLLYTAIDVSPALVLLAAAEASSVIPGNHCQRVVCDLAQAPDLPDILAQFESLHTPRHAPPQRIITWFGMLPNFEPAEAMRVLKPLVKPGDHLLLSANLAPGADYSAGVRKILPQYDNEPCRAWLVSFLTYIGIPTNAGRLRIGIENDGDLQRITAHYEFTDNCAVIIGHDKVQFQAGSTLRLFYSYRHTPETVRTLLESNHIKLQNQWITSSGEEGVFAGIPLLK